jgi:hypothetical protein
MKVRNASRMVLGAMIVVLFSACISKTSDTTATPQSDLAHPNALLYSDAEKKYFSAAGGYLKTTFEEDRKLVTVMAGAPSGESTLGDIKSAIKSARFVESAGYFGDYKPAAVPSGFEELDNKISRCKRLHDSAFEELLEYWRDSNTAHIESGNATLRQAVMAVQECVDDLNRIWDRVREARSTTQVTTKRTPESTISTEARKRHNKKNHRN